MNVKLVVGTISTFSPVIPLIAGYRKKPSLVWYYILLGLVFNLLGGKVLRGMPVAKVVANDYVLIEFFFISFFFLPEFNRKQRWIIYAGLAALVFCLTSIIVSGFSNFNFLGAAVLSFFYIAYCMTALYVVMMNAAVKDVFSSSFFMLTIGILIYFSGMFFLFSIGNYFRKHEILWGLEKYTLMGRVWIINSFCNIVQSLIFAKAFWIEKRQQKIRIPSS